MALGTQPVGKLLDYEQYIEHQIRRTRSRIKMTDVLTACLVLSAAGLGILFLEVVLDHTLGLHVWVRRLVLWSGLVGALYYVGRRIVLPMVSRVNGLFAAKVIEDAHPAFKNSLISYLDLRRSGQPVSKSFLAAVEARAVKDLTEVEIDAVVNQRRLLQMAYTLSGIVVVFCLYAALTPKSILDSTRRALLADVVRPTNTRLVNIKPGDRRDLSRVVSGTNVVFSVEIQGTRPNKVRLHYSTDGGKYYSAADFAPGANYYDPWQTTLRDVRQDLDYYLTGGDAESLKYHLEVVPAPMVTSVALDLAFPEYTGVAPRKGVEGGSVEAIEGTTVTVHARTNEPASAAYFDFSRGQDNKNPPMEVGGDDAKTLVGSFVVKQSGTYTIKFRTTGGQLNPDPVVYDIHAIPDKPPTDVVFLRPDKPEISVPANVSVPLLMTASDDFGVKEAILRVREGNETLYSVDLLEKLKPTRRFKGSFTLDLAEKKVKPGAVVEYWLTVRDTKTPTSNRAESTRQIIKVVAPVKEAEKKAIEDRARKEQADADKQVPPEPTDLENPQTPDDAPMPGEENKPGAEGGARDNDRGAREPKDAGARDSEGANDQPGTGDEKAENPTAPPPLTPEDRAKIDKLERAMQNRQGPQPPRSGARSGDPSSAPQDNNPPAGNTNPQTPDSQGRPNGPSEGVSQGTQALDRRTTPPTRPVRPRPRPPGRPAPPATPTRSRAPTRPRTRRTGTPPRPTARAAPGRRLSPPARAGRSGPRPGLPPEPRTLRARTTPALRLSPEPGARRTSRVLPLAGVIRPGQGPPGRPRPPFRTRPAASPA